MQFFTKFDGNNILFLVWIACILLFFYDIEAKGWKFHLKGNEEMQQQFACAESTYINQMTTMNGRDNIQPQEPDGMEGVTSNE